MSGKGYNSDDEEHQTRPEILTLALGWTHSLFYIVMTHLLILAVQIYLLWPLLPNFPHVWGDTVVGRMVMVQYLIGFYGYATPFPEIPALFGPLSHVFGMAAIIMILVHTVSITTSFCGLQYLLLYGLVPFCSSTWLIQFVSYARWKIQPHLNILFYVRFSFYLFCRFFFDFS